MSPYVYSCTYPLHPILIQVTHLIKVILSSVFFVYHVFMPVFRCLLLSAGAAYSGAVSTSGTDFEKRATSCTFTDAASVVKAKTSCPTITLNGIAVPAGKTLDLTKLPKGTHASWLCSLVTKEDR